MKRIIELKLHIALFLVVILCAMVQFGCSCEIGGTSEDTPAFIFKDIFALLGEEQYEEAWGHFSSGYKDYCCATADELIEKVESGEIPVYLDINVFRNDENPSGGVLLTWKAKYISTKGKEFWVTGEANFIEEGGAWKLDSFFAVPSDY